MIALMNEAARTSETSVDIDFRTRRYIPEDSELHIRRRENLKSHHYVLLTMYMWAYYMISNIYDLGMIFRTSF
jgi:hypothetical protein